MDKQTRKYALYAAVAAGVYFLFFKNKGGAKNIQVPKSAAMVGPAKSQSYVKDEPAKEGDPTGGLQVPAFESGLVDINTSGAELIGLNEAEETSTAMQN